MYFKSLELYGFKSFAGKTKVEFEPGITAIVGPNGCGKSNIVDALKWVLGEQSAKDLRGLNMEDVIFNGTDTRDPVGFAEVSLTMSNESRFLPIEYDEIVISRRLFRSGESEYLLNKNQVRLKDIVELFMGTGVGTSAYSIIAQGKIDMIISSKPEDRRHIFEEASGIIKYKSKKREAARKLEYTENNLLRINDIMVEVKRQIGSIERQARKAERYREEFEKLKTQDTKSAFREFKALTSEKEDIEKQVLEHKDNESRLLKEVEELESKLTSLKASQAEAATKLSEAQFKEVNLNSNVDRSRDKINLNTERHKELEGLKQTLLNEQDAIQKNILELEKAVASLSKEIEGITGNKVQRESSLNQKEEQLKKLEEGLKQSDQNIRDGKLKMVDVLNSQSRTKNDLTKLSSDLTNHQARLRRLKIEEEKVKEEEAGIRNQFGQIETEVNNLEVQIKDNIDTKATLETQLNQKNSDRDEVGKKYEELQSKQLSLGSRLTVLKDMIKRYEGFGGGSQRILLEKQENRLSIPGVYGAVAELINVRKGYEAAVETSLGDLLQCIVVEDKNAARDLIHYLKQKNLGKATVVSLDAIKKADTNMSLQDGILGKLEDFVDTEARFKDLISVLFHNVFLAKDLDALLDPRMSSVKDAEFVTLDGELLKDGFLTGGVTKDDTGTGILNRKNQVHEIDIQLSEIKNQIADLESRKASLTEEIDTLTEKINLKQEALRQDELELANKKSQKDSIGAALKKMTDELALLNLELDEVTDEINSVKEKQVLREEEIKKLDEEHNTVQGLISEAQSFIETGLKQKEGLLIEITKMQTELSAVSEQEGSLSSSLKMRSDFLTTQKRLLGEKKKGFDEAALRQGELIEETNNLQAMLENSSEEKKKISLEFQDVKNKKSELEGLLSREESEFKKKEDLLNSIKDTLHNSHMKLQENSFKAETLKTRINQAYKVELDQLDIAIEEDIDWEAMANEIAELRQKIEKMGPVNLVAIEEHQELKERHEFLIKQQEDLVNAKESLLEAIKKINKTTRELFMDTFQKVRVEFKEYYRFLFGGGQAELVLMDEQDILECGIEIMARPPGKKLQSISLLSGGEKALTAIALLFSIFKIKPSPFCILDEVDAPLDESNIGRFSKLLAEFTKTSQFIIITHNKRTISMADVMYGITMEQSGVSKVVSVKFAREGQKAQVAS